VALTTWNDIVRRALIEIGAVAAVETPSDEEFSDGIDDLQGMLDEWALEGLFVPALTIYRHTIQSPPKATFTISAEDSLNPDIAGVPPVEIETLAYSHQGEPDGAPMVQTSYVVWKENQASEASSPSLFYYENEYPVGRIYFNTGTMAGDSFSVAGDAYLTSDDIMGEDAHKLPRGYARGVMLNLAVTLAASYGVKGGLAPSTVALAAMAKRNIRKRNIGSMAFRLDRALTTRTGGGVGSRRYGYFWS